MNAAHNENLDQIVHNLRKELNQEQTMLTLSTIQKLFKEFCRLVQEPSQYSGEYFTVLNKQLKNKKSAEFLKDALDSAIARNQAMGQRNYTIKLLAKILQELCEIAQNLLIPFQSILDVDGSLLEYSTLHTLYNNKVEPKLLRPEARRPSAPVVTPRVEHLHFKEAPPTKLKSAALDPVSNNEASAPTLSPALSDNPREDSPLNSASATPSADSPILEGPARKRQRTEGGVGQNGNLPFLNSACRASPMTTEEVENMRVTGRAFPAGAYGLLRGRY